MSARILVADDSVTIQKVVELTFSKEDFTLIQARSGEETIRKAKEARPDVILLDLVMPDKNGYDVCSALRAEPSLQNTPIILLAGTFESFDPARGLEVGANDFITKPFESQNLIGKVKQLLFAKSVTARVAEPAQPAWEPPMPTRAPAPPAPLPDPQAKAAPPPPAGAVPDDPWQLLAGYPGPPPAPAPPAAPPPPAPAPSAHEAPGAPDLGELDLTPADAPVETPGLDASPGPADDLSLPDALSLDDLLIADADAPPVLPSIASEAPPHVTGPVFELPTDEMPLLPMVEAAPGAPPPVVEEAALLEAPPTPAPVPADLAPTLELGEMRQEVAARVANDLTRELSQKLLERFEKIVWEVVPDLAEVLITKEIERIRRVAEGEHSL
jgi:CheY-like chemotaxis protein